MLKEVYIRGIFPLLQRMMHISPWRRRYVIPSAARNLSTLHRGCYVRSFSSLRSVQNDMTWGSLSDCGIRSNVNTT